MRNFITFLPLMFRRAANPCRERASRSLNGIPWQWMTRATQQEEETDDLKLEMGGRQSIHGSQYLQTSCNDQLKPFTSHGHDRERSCNYWIYEKRIVPDLTKPNEEFNYFNLRKCILEPDYMKQRHEHTEFFNEQKYNLRFRPCQLHMVPIANTSGNTVITCISY